MKKNQFHVLYVAGCTPVLRSFTSRRARTVWLAEFLLDADEWDNFVQIVFNGEIEHVQRLDHVRIPARDQRK